MQKTAHCFTTKSKITSLIKLDGNKFYYDTFSDGLKIFLAPQSKTFKNIQFENFNPSTTIVSVSYDAKLIAFCNKNIVNIISVETNSIINTIDVYDVVTSICFDDTNRYIFVGTSVGEVLQYRFNKALKLSVLYRFIRNKYNFTNIIVSNQTKLVSSDMYGTISIVDIYTCMIQKFSLNSRVKATAISLYDENILIGDAKGDLTFFSCEKNKIIKNLMTPFIKISQIIKTPNKKYMLLNSDNYYITLVNLELKKITILKYLSFEYKIISIAINDDGLLYIAFENNDIINLSIYNTEKLNDLIEKDSINKAYNLVKSNPLLENTIECEFLEQRYKLAYKEATLGLIYSDKTAIIRLKSLYGNIETKKEDIDDLEKAFKEYKHLKDLFLEKKYTICYALIDKFPPLKATLEYKKLEQRYKSSLLSAQHFMSINQQELAREILQDYITIQSKRPTIKPLLENNQEYLAHQEINKIKAKLDINTLTFHRAYNHNDFKRCYEILDENLSLNDLELAKLLNKHYQKIILKCDEFALDGDIQNIQKDLGELLKISTRKKKTGDLLRVSFRAKIKKLIDKKVFKEAENMIYSYMDIFGMDFDLSILMKEFEKSSSVTLAISEQRQIKKDENAWYYSDFFKS